mgnify:CR=1 FL=1
MAKKSSDWTVLSMLEWATTYFKENNISSPRMSIEWLLAEVLQIKRLDLYLQYDRPLSPDELNALRPLVKRRAGHEPLQYISGSTDFMNARIRVSPEVLIPRLETEQLVELILSEHDPSPKNVIDIGTGSGCIAIALKMERPEWQVSALEKYGAALEVAKKNAQTNQAEIHWLNEDIRQWTNGFTSITESYNLIVSNPPYIPQHEKEGVEPQVREYEPAEALFVQEADQYYKTIRDMAAEHLTNGGYLYFEIHQEYGMEISGLFDPNRWNVAIFNDYDGNARFLRAIKR